MSETIQHQSELGPTADKTAEAETSSSTWETDLQRKTAAKSDEFGARRLPSASKDAFAAPLPSRRPAQRTTWPEQEDRQSEIVPPVSKQITLPAMPRRKQKKIFGTGTALIFFVILPTILVAVYYYRYAPNQYVSEFRFSVTQGNPVLPGSSAAMIGPGASASGGALSSLASALGSGSSAASPQNFMVTDYLTSRQAVDDLQKLIDVKAMYSKPAIPWWERFDRSNPDEAFIKYFRNYIYTNYDQVTGLAVASVRSYSAQDTSLIARSLSELSEKLVNDLNSRANTDAIRFAQDEVDRMEVSLTDVNAKLLKYRKAEGTINPNNGAVNINLTLEQSLQSTLSTLETQMGAMSGQKMSRDAPVLKTLRSQIRSTKDQMKRIEDQIAVDSNRSRALAKVVGNYEDLIFNQQYAQGMVIQTRQALALAKANAAAQHLYIVPYVRPTEPDSSDYPNRPMNVLLAGLAFFGIWFGGLMIYKSIQDHAY